MPRFGPAVPRVVALGATLILWATSPAVVMVAMLVAATASTTAGVWLLFGKAWALIAVSAILFGLAGLMLRGLGRG